MYQCLGIKSAFHKMKVEGLISDQADDILNEIICRNDKSKHKDEILSKWQDELYGSKPSA